MGNSQSSSPDPRFVSASRAFTQHGLQELKSLFESLAVQSQSNGQFITPPVFKAYFKIPSSLGDRMFDLMTQKRHDQKLTFEDFVIAKGTYEKGTKNEIEEFIYQLVDVTDDGKIDRYCCQSYVVYEFYNFISVSNGELFRGEFLLDDLFLLLYKIFSCRIGWTLLL
ncbi:Lysophosphatidylcholine acyltransferase 2 [Bienertia sinuspersici]